MNLKVLILAICAYSACGVPTGDLNSILSPILSAKTGIIKAAQGGVNGHFDRKLSSLDQLSNSLGGLLGGAGGGSGGFNPLKIFHSLLGNQGSKGSNGNGVDTSSHSTDFNSDNSFDSGYESSGSQFQTQQLSAGGEYSQSSGYSYQPPPPPPPPPAQHSGYNYLPPSTG